MDEARVSVVSKVERGKVDEVDDEDYLGPNEVGVDEEEDKDRVENVVDNEVAAYGSCSRRDGAVRGEEMRDVAKLKDEENYKVDGGDD